MRRRFVVPGLLHLVLIIVADHIATRIRERTERV